MKKLILLFALILSMSIFCLCSCSVVDTEATFEDITINVGDKVQLISSITIAGKSVPVEYTFVGEGISIENGMVTGLVAESTTVVTASATGMETKQFNVTVNRSSSVVVVKPSTEIKMAFNDMTLAVADNVALPATVDIGLTTYNLSYSFEGENIKIEDGKVEALVADTTTTVTATATGFTATFNVTVVAPEVKSVLNDMALSIGDVKTLPAKVNVNGTDLPLTYTVSGSGVSIEGTKLTAVSASTGCVVTASANGFVGTFNVTVSEKQADVEVALVLNDVVLTLGERMAIAASINIGGEEKSITYTYDGENISIKNNVITALVTNSKTTVTAEAEGFYGSFVVTVVKGANVGTMTINAPVSIYVNSVGVPLKATFSDERFVSEVVYTSDNENVYVKDGVLYATGDLAAGTVVAITAKSDYHETTFRVKICNDGVNSKGKVEYYQKNLIKDENKGGIIFVGDSYFDGYPKPETEMPPFWADFYKDYADEKAFLMGVSSSQIHDLEAISNAIVYPMEPSEIVIHIGFNDVHHGNLTPAELAERIQYLVKSYKQNLPDVKIYYIGVEPKKNGYNSNDSYYNSSSVKAPELTRLMKEFAAETEWFTYVDTLDLCIKEDGTINTNFYLNSDLSHPTLASYDSIRERINAARAANASTDEAQPAKQVSVLSYGKEE